MQFLPTTWSDRWFLARKAPPVSPIDRVNRTATDAVLTSAIATIPVITTAAAMMHTREVYSVSGHRVTKEAASGWTCECPVFVPHLQCDHVREALRLQNVRQPR